MQPCSHCRGRADRGRLRREHDEDGLEGILGQVVVAGDPAADSKDEPAVTSDEFGECSLIAACDEAREQLAIAGRDRPVGGAGAEVVHETVELRSRHSECPHAGKVTSQPVYPRPPPGASKKIAAFGLLSTLLTT